MNETVGMVTKKEFTAPLVYRGLPAKTAVMLSDSGIAFEPKGSVPYQIFSALSHGRRGKVIRDLVKRIKPWQKKRIGKILHEYVRRREILTSLLDRLKKEGRNDDANRLPISAISMTEKCNRGCPHCGVLADMSLQTMPFSDFERYLGLIDIKTRNLTFSGAGEQFMYGSEGKNLGDAIARILEKFPGIFVEIVTSGVSFSDKNSIETKAAERIARLNEADKTRLLVLVSVRSFMKERMEDAKKTVKFFIENGIKVMPRLEGVTFVLDKNGKWTRNWHERTKIFSDLVECFGIRPEDAAKIPTQVKYSGSLSYMGRLIGRNVTRAMNEYYGDQPETVGRHIAITEWDSRRGICKIDSFGLEPDGSIIPGCCHLASVFLRLGSLKEANQDNIREMARQIKEDAKEMYGSIARSRKKDSCVPCVGWFRKRGREGGCIGIRDPERLKRAIPTLKQSSAIKKLKIKIPAKLALE